MCVLVVVVEVGVTKRRKQVDGHSNLQSQQQLEARRFTTANHSHIDHVSGLRVGIVAVPHVRLLESLFFELGMSP